MPNITAVAFDLISESQGDKADAANSIFEALSSSLLFGVKSLTGLTLVLYGGNMIVSGTPTAVPTQTLTLSDDATNYIYSTDSGVFVKVTSAPSGWPGPIVEGSPARTAIALYRLVTDSGFVTDDFDVYVPSVGIPGDTGAEGDEGPPGVDLASQRIRWYSVAGNTDTSNTQLGFSATSTGVTATSRTQATTSFRESIPYVAYLTSASASSQGQVYNNKAFCYRGDAAGRGGFTLGMRFCLESANSPANFRSFFGLQAVATWGNVEPDTFLNIIGVGSKTADANLSLIHNDGSGTATMVALGSNFPARATNNVYELTLTALANASTIDYRLEDCATGNVASGTASTNLPVNTTFLGFIAWCANGGTASAAAFGLMQVVGSTRW